MKTRRGGLAAGIACLAFAIVSVPVGSALKDYGAFHVMGIIAAVTGLTLLLAAWRRR